MSLARSESENASSRLPSPRFADGFIPNLVIAGAPKSGTSSLHRWLASHPHVLGSRQKETYFLTDPGTHMFRKTNSVLNGLSGYNAHFEPEMDQEPVVVLESTPSYMYHETALATLPDMPSRPRVIFILREPSAQIYSLFRYFQTNWNWIPPEVTFRKFVDLARTGISVDYRGNELARDALDNACYVNFLTKWRAALGSERMRIYLFEDLKRNPRALLQEVAVFAGIDGEYFEELSFEAFNQTITVRSRQLQKVNIAVRSLLPKGNFYNRARSVYRRLNTVAAPNLTEADTDTLRALKESFREPNRLLAELFEIDLSAWR